MLLVFYLNGHSFPLEVWNFNVVSELCCSPVFAFRPAISAHAATAQGHENPGCWHNWSRSLLTAIINPLTPRSYHDQYVNSPLNFNEMSVRQVLRMKIIISIRSVNLI